MHCLLANQHILLITNGKPHNRSSDTPTALNPQRWERTRTETGRGAAGANRCLQGVLHYSPPSVCCSWWPGHPVLMAPKNCTCCKVWSWCTLTSSSEHFLNEYPFAAYVRIRPKMFRKKLPSLYFFIYLYKINSRSLVCPYPWPQANSWEFKTNTHKFFSCTSADMAQDSNGISRTSSLTSGGKIQESLASKEILQGWVGRLQYSKCSPSISDQFTRGQKSPSNLICQRILIAMVAQRRN